MKNGLHINKVKGVIFGLCFILCGVSLPAKIISMSDAINKSGKQRMITQRMLKDYALIGMNNTYGNPKKDLESMIELFDITLKELKSFIKDEISKQSLSKVSILWESTKNILEDSPTKEKVLTLQVKLEKLLKETNKSTNLIVKASGTNTGQIINVSGKQRMLSQRMASLYMLKVWEVDNPKLDTEFSHTINEFEIAQETLFSSKLNTTEIEVLLKNSKKSFMFFQMMGNSKSKKFIPSLISRSANKILKNMNMATELYSVIK